MFSFHGYHLQVHRIKIKQKCFILPHQINLFLFKHNKPIKYFLGHYIWDTTIEASRSEYCFVYGLSRL
jgi:hypothetical protein